MTTTSRAPNRVLRAWREAQGMTRARMADALTEAAAAEGRDVLACRSSVIAAWESGRVRWPRPKYQRALHALTGQCPAALGFTAPALRPRLSAPAQPAGTGASTDEFARYLAAASRRPGFGAAWQDARALQRYARAVDACLTVTLTTHPVPGQEHQVTAARPLPGPGGTPLPGTDRAAIGELTTAHTLQPGSAQ
ncbi:MAG: hypothetical protein ACRDNF_17115 [Streptosporangiaceae bacterium]